MWVQVIVGILFLPVLLVVFTLTKPAEFRRMWWGITAAVTLVYGLALVSSASEEDQQQVETVNEARTTDDDLEESTTTERITTTTERITSTTTAPTTTAPPTTAPPTTAPPTTAAPTTAPPATAPPTTSAPTTAAPDCTPGYDPCIPSGGDVDCASGSGNGPRYVNGPVYVDQSYGDPYDLDRDGDGVGCEG